MKYFISNKTTKLDKNNKPYICATLTDEQGTSYEKINAFRGEFNGDAFEGSLEQNGKFWNLKPNVTYPANFPVSKTEQMSELMDKKTDTILFAQDRKNDAIQHAGAITNATNLLTASIAAGMHNIAGEEALKTKLREFITFYQNLYKYPDSINPAVSDEPPF